MCGIFATFSDKPKIINQAISNKEKIIETIKRRGPDKTNIIKDKDFIAIHTLLSITGGRTPQPVLTDKFLMVFNGEIYNDYLHYNQNCGDTDCLTKQLWDREIKSFKELDGEFAIGVKFFSSNTLVLATDPFGTKPLYYQLGADHCTIGSYESTIVSTGNSGQVLEMPANTLIEINLKDFTIKNKAKVKDFDFLHQTTTSFENWNNAFRKAILKRTKNKRHKIFISFSAGHDTGLIIAELIENKIPFKGYTVPYKENIRVLNKRLKILKEEKIPYEIINITEKEFNRIQKFLSKNCEPFQLINKDCSFRNFKDPDMRKIPGYIVSAIIHQKAREENRLITLSGQGGDEIIADYYNKYANPAMSELKGNWQNVKKPWKNFQGGWNRVFLQAGERIAGTFGIETRYPFLDFEVVQEFINLTPELKSRYYKAPITARLKELNFPFHFKKQGFAGWARE